LALAVATIAALFSGHGIAADLAEITALIVLLQFGRIACNLRIERKRVRTLIDSTERLERLANVDMLTDLPNRAALEIRLDEEMERAARYGQPMSVCFVDIDHFKRVNDLYGHSAGDSVLRRIAGCLQLTARSIDFVGRYGGEEFVIIAPGTWSADALVLAERIRGQVGKLAVDAVSGEPIDLSVSIGIAGFPEHADTLDILMERADAALYQSKANGRNRVTLWGADPQR
jgi:diguanylate cyclase (GGDEF)-like protein